MLNLKKIGEKWQKRWKDDKTFKTVDPTKTKKNSRYILEMFPYPSASGLHMGHVRNYSLGDVCARFKRMQGFNVLYPMGYDSFGLPAENAAIKEGRDPNEVTEGNIKGIKRQQQTLGMSYDWSRELATSHADYYKWNQWFFVKMFEKGLAYKKGGFVNWCPECNTVLANEQVEDGKCWRHGDTEVEQRDLEQWFLKITDYADELLTDIDKLDHWPERVKTMQKNWIGRSEGTLIQFKVKDMDLELETFTTRPDTCYGITYLVIAAEHPIIDTLLEGQDDSKKKEVKDFIKKVKQQTIIERTAEGKPKNGVYLGRNAINPLTGEEFPLWVADYALYEYGTGMVMAVPAHDQRDFEFAKKYKLPIKLVISPDAYDLNAEKMARAYVEDGKMVNSAEFDSTPNRDAMKGITDKLVKLKAGKRTINYKLRDWLISRQRYWGTPIPIIYCDTCGAVPEKNLPVELPQGADFQKGGNPLTTVKDFVNTTCPKCKGKATRETDTMDTFVDSSWYFLRFCDPQNDKEAFGKKIADKFMPVDQYIGGIEHAVMHLLYARFFTKVLRDMKLVDVDEPFTRLLTLGMVTKDGAKMSKSIGNTVDPGEIIDKFGPDTARLFILFAALPEKELEWSDQGVEASHRFLQRVAALVEDITYSDGPTKHDTYVESKLHSAIKNITAELDSFRYSMAIQHLMELTGVLQKYKEGGVHKSLWDDAMEALVKLLSPVAPHLCEELWEKLGHDTFVSVSDWPKYHDSKIDHAAEAAYEAIEDVSSDIRTVLELAKIENPKNITLFMPEAWKYDFVLVMKAQLEQTADPKEIIGAIMATDLKKQGQVVMKLVPAMLKDRSKLPEYLMSKKDELKLYASFTAELGERFGCSIEVVAAEDSKEPKAKQAMPGKPAILLK
ncbi:leucine--tRNA ligase [Candidatus Woesearchaeota archaeon]|nr:leucine--tRNA ligase [Candidatus Woesearchaeota archaeon]